jgi:mevalonate kinase
MPEYDDPDGEVDFSEADALRPVAHHLGLSTVQFKGLVKAATDANMARQSEQIRAQKSDQDSLKREWGAAYTLRMNQLKSFLDVNGAPPNLKAAIETGGIDSHSAKWIYNIMETIGGETAEVSGQGKGGSSTTLTPTEALDRVAEIEKRMQNMAQGTDEYTQLLGRRIDLLRLAHPQ